MAQTAIDFNWADVPGATSYELTVQRVGGQLGQRAISLNSNVLVSMLDAGTAQTPTQYRWTVTPYENGNPGTTSAESFFGVASGSTVDFAPGENGPGRPRSAEELVTRLYFQNVGMFLEWEGVVGASGYEIQIARAEDLNGNPLNQLHYRMTVGATQAVVTNVSIPGMYRFDVRGIVSGAPGESSSGLFYLVNLNNLDQTGDYIVDTYDLLELQSKWRQAAFLDDIIGNGAIDQDDLIALLIRLKKFPLKLPGFRKTVPLPSPSLTPPVKSGQKSAAPVRTGWIEGISNTLFGSPAYAGEIPDGSMELEAPRILFPTCGSCGITTLPYIWTEVPGATSYEVQMYNFSIPNRRIVASLGVTTTEVLDDVVGDGVVSTELFSTYQQTYFVVGVRGVMAGQKGPLSRRVAQRISFTCPQPAPRPIIPLDFDGDRRYEGPDLFAYAAAWKSATPSAEYNPGLELDPPFFPDGDVAQDDLLAYLELFRERCVLPKSPALDPPLQESPLPNQTIVKPQNVDIFFSWIPPASTEFSSPLAYEIQITGGQFGNETFRKFVGNEFGFLKLLGGVGYRWRVRAIADDGTPGFFSPYRVFNVDTDAPTPDPPTLMAPFPDEVLAGGSVRFVWSREPQVMPNQCRFDRLMIHGGSILRASFDIYHKASEVDEPTLEVTIPLFPNFGPDFSWAVRPFEESTDSLGKVFILGGQPSEFRSFQIDRPTDIPEFSGLGTWKADINGDGDFDFTELGQVQTAWKRARNTSPGYDVNFDFNYNRVHEPGELVDIFNAFAGNINLLTTGRPAPIPIGPNSPHGPPPPLFSIADAQRGTVLTWFPTGPADKYMVEWIDPKYQFRGVYAEQLDPIQMIQPASGETVVLASGSSVADFAWEAVTDAQEYQFQINNLRNGFAYFRLVVPKTVDEATTSIRLTAAEIVANTSPENGDPYSYLVIPKACGHFSDLPAAVPFNLELGFPTKTRFPKTTQVDLNTELRLPLLLTAQSRVPALERGLHHWRATTIGRGVGTSTGIPSRWNSFGIGDRGLGFN
jgi:hypothetical protein